MPAHSRSSVSPSSFPWIAGQASLAIALVLALSGCAPSALSSARSQIAAGNYPAARQELVALSANSDLSESERREVKDDLCLCDFMIGRPTYTLSEQRRVCSDAAKDPDSQSSSIIAQIDDAARRKDAQEVEAALAAHDLADAERAATDYQSLPGRRSRDSCAMVEGNLDAGGRAGVRRHECEEALARGGYLRGPQEPSRRRKKWIRDSSPNGS